MDTEQAKIVAAVARNHSFSKAASELSYAQSTISKRILSLEAELGVRLFERKGKARIELTEAGEAALPLISGIDETYQQLLRSTADLRSGRAGHFSVGVLNGFSTFGEDEIMLGFSKANPQISIRQVEGSITALLSSVREGGLDAAFIALVDPEPFIRENEETLAIRDVCRLNLKVSMPAKHPCAKKDGLVLSDLKNQTFLFREFHEHMENDVKIRRFVSACQSEGFEPKIEFVDCRSAMVFSMIAAGQGVAPLMFKPKAMRSDVVTRPFSKEYYHFEIKLVSKAGNDSPVLQVFQEYVDKKAPLPRSA